jgi:hypothetical protein
VPPEIVRDLPERLQELLGYNVYPPFLGYVDGRHPRRVLDDNAAHTSTPSGKSRPTDRPPSGSMCG